MSEFNRHWFKAYEIDSNGFWTPAQRDYYLASEVDTLLQSRAQELSERDRREGELLSMCDTLTRELEAERTLCAHLDERTKAAESELAALRQQLREVTEWRPMETAPMDGTSVLLNWPYWSQEPMLARYDLGWQSERILSDGESSPLGWLPLPPLPKEVERGE